MPAQSSTGAPTLLQLQALMQQSAGPTAAASGPVMQGVGESIPLAQNPIAQNPIGASVNTPGFATGPNVARIGAGVSTDGSAPAFSPPATAMPAQAAAPNPMRAATGLAAGAGTLGNGNTNPLAQLMQRQLAQRQPGGAGTPQQQAQGMMGQLGAPAGATQGAVGAAQGATTVPGTTAQSPFFNASNAANAVATQQAAAGGSSGGLGNASLSALEGAALPAVQSAISQAGANTTYGAFNQNFLSALQQAGYPAAAISAIAAKLPNASNPGADMQNAGGGNTAANINAYDTTTNQVLSGMLGLGGVASAGAG
jgi:hypothetical protein